MIGQEQTKKKLAEPEQPAAEGEPEVYALPLAFAVGPAADDLIARQPFAALARVRGAAEGVIYDAMYDPGLTTDDFARKVAAALGVNPTIRHVPVSLALAGAACIEVGSRLMRRDPFLTRYQVAILARNQGFSIAKARGTLGFRPEVTLDEALARTARWITESFPAK